MFDSLSGVIKWDKESRNSLKRTLPITTKDRISNRSSVKLVDLARNGRKRIPKNGFRRIFIDATNRFEKNEKYERGARTLDKNQDHRILRDPYENRDEKMSGKILGEKARAEIKIVIDILRQDLISCNVYLIGITKPGEDLIRKQEMLVKIQEIIVYLREVSDACKKADDILGYAMKEMSNFEERMKAFEEIAKNKFSHLENVSEKLMTFEKCWRSSFSIALKKLRSMDKEF